MLNKLFCGQFDITKDGTEETRAQHFAGMHWHGRHSPVRMSQENVASTGSNNLEPDSSKDANGFFAADPRKPSHTEIC